MADALSAASASQKSRALARLEIAGPRLVARRALRHYLKVHPHATEAELKKVRRAANLVARYHVWKHTPHVLRDDSWPRNFAELAERCHASVSRMRAAIDLVKYPYWEKFVIPKVDPEVRAAMIRNELDLAIARQREIADPARYNANLFRVALTTNGAMPRPESPQKIKVTNNTVNILTTPEQLKEAEERLKLYAQRLYAREVALEEPTDEVPERTDGQ